MKCPMSAVTALESKIPPLTPNKQSLNSAVSVTFDLKNFLHHPILGTLK